MADNSFRMPSGSGGLVRYSDEYGSKIQIKPIHVIGLIVAVTVLEIILRLTLK
jgi:preprotein translocase subunit Sec61beta